MGVVANGVREGEFKGGGLQEWLGGDVCGAGVFDQ